MLFLPHRRYLTMIHRQCCVFTPDQSVHKQDTSHCPEWSHPQPGRFHKSGIWNTGLLVQKVAIYFGNGYLSLCFLLHVVILLLWHLPSVQSDSHQMRQLHTNKTLC